MAKTRRKKKRTHTPSVPRGCVTTDKTATHSRDSMDFNAPSSSSQSVAHKIPRTFVVKRGRYASSAKPLVEDLRRVMEPYTARKLRDSAKSNKLNDFLTVSGPLGVTHVMIVSATEKAKYLKIIRTPRGPTVTFKIKEHALEKDVKRQQKQPKSRGKAFLNPALVVLNNFGKQAHEQLCAATFQNAFPAVNAKKAKLSSCKRVVLVDYDEEDGKDEEEGGGGTYRLRHYHVDAKPAKGDKKLRRMLQTRDVPDLGALSDVSDFFSSSVKKQEDFENAVDATLSDASDSEDDPHSRVELSQDLDRINRAKSTTKIQLKELGPRLDLELVKIEEGACDGRVMYHRYVVKTADQADATERSREERARLKCKRRVEQERNVERKKIKKKEQEELKVNKKKSSSKKTTTKKATNNATRER